MELHNQVGRTPIQHGLERLWLNVATMPFDVVPKPDDAGRTPEVFEVRFFIGSPARQQEIGNAMLLINANDLARVLAYAALEADRA